MHGILLHREGRFAEAVALFEQAEALGNRTAASNRGNSLLDMGRMADALRAHEEAVVRAPESAGALYNLALTRLRLGDWKRGWADYESRWHFHQVYRTPRKLDCPRWRGELLDGQRVLLHAEQGLGDTIQFCRYVAMVEARGGTVILQVQFPVARLMSSLPPVKAGLARVAILGQTPPEFDIECPLISLPAVFGTTLETAPCPDAYLGADSPMVRDKWAQFPGLPGKMRVGLAWAGSPGYKADSKRSTNIKTLLPLLLTSGITWISLQKGPAAAQLSTLPAGISVLDGCSRDRDLADAAALIATLDLVITTDTCIAHLAGAMGKPVWILLPYLADWRWMEKRDTTPWYRTARLFRQPHPGDWAAIVERAIQELSRFRAPRIRPDRMGMRHIPALSDFKSRANLTPA